VISVEQQTCEVTKLILCVLGFAKPHMADTSIELLTPHDPTLVMIRKQVVSGESWSRSQVVRKCSIKSHRNAKVV
jgi:hypothetical protein